MGQHRGLAVAADIQRGVGHAHDRRVLAAVRAHASAARSGAGSSRSGSGPGGSSGAATARGRTGRRRPRSTSRHGASLAMKKPSVRSRCGSVCRNCGMVGCFQTGTSAAQVVGGEFGVGGQERLHDVLVLDGRDRAGRVDEGTAGPHGVGSGGQDPGLERGQRLPGGRPCASARRGARRACRGRCTAGRPARGRTVASVRLARRRAVRHSTIVAPMRAAVLAQRLARGRDAARRRRSRPRCPSARRGGWSCRRGRRRGRAPARRAAGASELRDGHRGARLRHQQAVLATRGSRTCRSGASRISASPSTRVGRAGAAASSLGRSS